jgi:hypothetical protein
VPRLSTGTTPKFDCRLPDGHVVKVKYGWSRERFAETAATRLLTALGFGADRVRIDRRVRCLGCPAWPFEIHLLAEQFMLTPVIDRLGDEDQARMFEWVSVEDKAFDRAVEVGEFKGWDWRELDGVSTSNGGAAKDELDALRLIAVFLAHWDTKAANQRLACLGPGDDDVEKPDEAKTCGTPLLMLQDLGATFGPSKVEYDAWSVLPIWKDAATCLVSMDNLPYAGDMFVPTRISESGRALLAARLSKLSDVQIRALFEGARFPDPVTGEQPAHDVGPWVEAFQNKVREISGRTCPAGAPAAAGRA